MESNDVVQTTEGPVAVGYTFEDLRWYLGIPYAAPPVGDLRWKNPQAALKRNNVYTADYLHPFCPQPCDGCTNFFGSFSMSEDCLYLNIFAPKEKVNPNFPNGYPVYFWIHGGGSIIGSANQFPFIAAYAALNNVVVVSINYRLNILGNFVSDRLDGNYAVKDQQFALKWVRKNIRNFSGDPNKITIGGQSAGAYYSSIHLTIPSSSGLFRQAILQSPDIGGGGVELRKWNEVKRYSDWLSIVAGCKPDDLPCLRNVPFENFLALVGSTYTRESYAGLSWYGNKSLIRDLPVFVLGKGKSNPVKAILGGNVKDEGEIDVYEHGDLSTWTNYVDFIFKMNSSRAYDILGLYPYDETYGGYPGYFNLNNDRSYHCPIRRSFMGLNRNSKNIALYLYEFAYFSATNPCSWSNELCTDGKVCHGAELMYTFNLMECPAGALTDTDRAVGDIVSGYWINFIHSGDPNVGPIQVKYSTWPKYSVDNPRTLQFTSNPNKRIIGDTYKRPCNFWDKLPYSGYVI
jgi:carboxylesterase type B